eukprot:symbB.v1.2.012673.t1/scaffold881.1/size155427/12
MRADDGCLPPANRVCGSTVLAAILLWILAIICVFITAGSVVAVKECRASCGLGCVAEGVEVACEGKAEACFKSCRKGFDSFDQEQEFQFVQECIDTKNCELAAKDEQAIAAKCEEQQACDQKGFLGTGRRFFIMFTIASILPVASTLCMGLYQEAFRWDEVIRQKMNFYDGFGRVILIIGAFLTIYVVYLLLETYSHPQRKGIVFIGTVVSLFALMVNCGACLLVSLARRGCLGLTR